MPLNLDDAVIILDKPYGHSSHEITTYVKKLLGAKRAGHAGTLDPGVSGVLPIALGKATKLLQYIAGKKKTYVGIIKFKKILTNEQIKNLFVKFTGTITQTPPLKSAVRKVPRKRTIYSLKLLEVEGRLALFETEVDAGTYIRTLCEDIGKLCGGARMEELRRIAVGNIKEGQATSLTKLIDSVWLSKNKKPAELNSMFHTPQQFIDFKKVIIKDSAISSILNGAQIAMPAIASYPKNLEKDELVSLYNQQNTFIGVGQALLSAQELAKQQHGIAIKIKRIHYSK